MLYTPDFIPSIDPADGLISRASMAKYILLLLSEDYAQKRHLTSWCLEVSHELWNKLQDHNGLAPDERALFLGLAKTADGWWAGSDKNGFIPLSQWIDNQ